jgi:hypothetical protein
MCIKMVIKTSLCASVISVHIFLSFLCSFFYFCLFFCFKLQFSRQELSSTEQFSAGGVTSRYASRKSSAPRWPNRREKLTRCTIRTGNIHSVGGFRFKLDTLYMRGTRWHSWLRNCATSRKVAGSIPDVILILFWHNPSGRTMALGSTQSLTEMSTMNISWGRKGGQCVELTLPLSCADCLEIWEPQPTGTLRACPGL